MSTRAFADRFGTERVCPAELNGNIAVVRTPIRDYETSPAGRAAGVVATSGAWAAPTASGASAAAPAAPIDTGAQSRIAATAAVDVTPAVAHAGSGPPPPRPIMDSALSRALMAKWMKQHRLIAALFSFDGFIYARLSAQIYNCEADYEKLVGVSAAEVAEQEAALQAQ